MIETVCAVISIGALLTLILALSIHVYRMFQEFCLKYVDTSGNKAYKTEPKDTFQQ